MTATDLNTRSTMGIQYLKWQVQVHMLVPVVSEVPREVPTVPELREVPELSPELIEKLRWALQQQKPKPKPKQKPTNTVLMRLLGMIEKKKMKI